jgi:hypothetical protein
MRGCLKAVLFDYSAGLTYKFNYSRTAAGYTSLLASYTTAQYWIRAAAALH